MTDLKITIRSNSFSSKNKNKKKKEGKDDRTKSELKNKKKDKKGQSSSSSSNGRNNKENEINKRTTDTMKTKPSGNIPKNNTRKKSSIRKKNVSNNREENNDDLVGISSSSTRRTAIKSSNTTSSLSPSSSKSNGMFRKVKGYFNKITNSTTTTTAINALKCKESEHDNDDYADDSAPWGIRCTDIDDDYDDNITSSSRQAQEKEDDDDSYSYHSTDDDSDIFECSPFINSNATGNVNNNNNFYQYKGTSNNTANCCSDAGIISLTVSESLREILNTMGNAMKDSNYALNRNNGSYYSKNQKKKQRTVRFSAIDLIHENYDDIDHDNNDIYFSSIDDHDDDDDDDILLNDHADEITISTESTASTTSIDDDINHGSMYSNGLKCFDNISNYKKNKKNNDKKNKENKKEITNNNNDDRPTFDHPLDILRKDGLDALSSNGSSSSCSSSNSHGNSSLAHYVEKNGLTLVQQDINNCVLIMPNNSL